MHMRKMKNAVIGTLLIATLLLTGCGSKSKNENVNPDMGNTETESITELVTESTEDTEVSTESELVTETETTADSQLPSETPVPSESEVVESEAPAELDITLCKAATMRSIEMTYAQYFEHCRADGRSPFTAISYYGFSRIAEGENIGVGFCDVPLGTSRQRFWTQLFAQEYVYVEPDWDAYEEWLESQHGQEGQKLEEAETEN